MTDHDTYAQKIAKLILKAENTDSEAEADAFLTKAQELQIRYQIDQAAIIKAKRQGEPEKLVELTFEVGKRGAGVWGRRNLAFAVCNSQAVKGFTRNHTGEFVIGGFETDVAFALMLYNALLLHAEAELKVALKDKPDWTHGATFRTNFYEGYVQRVTIRLAEQRKRAHENVAAAVADEQIMETNDTVTVSQSMGLIVQARAKQAEDFINAKYNLRTVRAPAAKHCGYSRAAGDKAGRRADITPSTGKVGASGQKALGR